jgi:hypothetical protein
MRLTPTEHLAALVGHPERVHDMPLDALLAILIELAGLQCAIAARVASQTTIPTAEPDRLVNVEAAAAVLGGVSEDFLYRSPAARSFRVKVGGRVLFSAAGIQQYIRRRAGR